MSNKPRREQNLVQSTKLVNRLFAALVIAGLALAGIYGLLQNTSAEICDNQIDDDGDSYIDDLDPDCAGYSGFTRQRSLIIDASKVIGESNFTDFPLLVSHTDPDFRHISQGGQMQHLSAWDLQFRTESGLILSHEVQKYNPATGELIVWVKVPTLSATSDTRLRIYFSKSGVSTNPSTTQTWSNAYLGRWHMEENPAGTAPQLKDASPTAANGSSSGAMPAGNQRPGIIGQSLWFDGNDDFFDVGTGIVTGSNFTLSAWISSRQTSGRWHGFLGFQPATVQQRPPSLWVDGVNGTWTALHGGFGNGTDWNAAWVTPSGIISNDSVTWNYVSSTFDGVNYRIYVDGVLRHTHNTGGRLPINTPVRHIGRVDNFFRGRIDEVAVVNAVRSAEWIATEYNNQSSPSTFYSISSNYSFPVEWLSFEAAESEGRAELNWVTAREQNSDYFEVERAGGDGTFSALGRVSAAGTTDQKQEYRFTDENPISAGNRVYYRLRQVDLDGQFSYSKTVELGLGASAGIALSMYPNPASDQVTLGLSGITGSGLLTAYDASGRRVWSQSAGSSELLLDVSSWPSGMYTVTLTDGTRQAVQKLVVQ